MFGADHAIIMKYDEGDLEQVQIPPETLYHRWNAELTFDRRRKGKEYVTNVDITVSPVIAPIFHDVFSLTHVKISRIHRSPQCAAAVSATPYIPPTYRSDTAKGVKHGLTRHVLQHFAWH